jgi:hypothetical protein
MDFYCFHFAYFSRSGQLSSILYKGSSKGFENARHRSVIMPPGDPSFRRSPSFEVIFAKGSCHYSRGRLFSKSFKCRRKEEEEE